MVETNQNVRRWVIFTDVYKTFRLPQLYWCVWVWCARFVVFVSLFFSVNIAGAYVCARAPYGRLCECVHRQLYNSCRSIRGLVLSSQSSSSLSVSEESNRAGESRRESQRERNAFKVCSYLCRPQPHVWKHCIWHRVSMNHSIAAI